MLRTAAFAGCLACAMSCSSPPQPSPMPQAQEQTHVTCVGDSITAGDGASSPQAAIIAKEGIPLLRQCAQETGVPTIDVFGALSPYPHYFVDGVHPNDQGAALIAQTVHDSIAGRRSRTKPRGAFMPNLP